MEKRIKRVLSLMLALILVLGVMPAGIANAEENEKLSYRWEIGEDADGNQILQSVATGIFTANEATYKNGTIVDGVLSEYYATLAKEIILDPGTEWVVEWKGSGEWDGFLLSRYAGNSGSVKIANNQYIWNVGDGSKLSLARYDEDLNAKICWTQLPNFDETVSYVYSMKNKVTTDDEGNYVSNMVYWYLNGEELGPVDNGTATSYVSGMGVEFSNIGSAYGKYQLNGLKLEYLEVHVNGDCEHNFGEWEHTCSSYTRTCSLCGDVESRTIAYRWEMGEDADGNQILQSVKTAGVYTENSLTEKKATRDENGVINNYSYQMSTPVSLAVDEAWSIEWKAAMRDEEATYRGMLLSNVRGDPKTAGNEYVFYNSTWMMGYTNDTPKYTNKSYSNSKPSDTEAHVYRLENTYTDEGWKVELWIDDVSYGSYETKYFTYDGSTLDYQYIGCNVSSVGSGWGIQNLDLEYLEIFLHGEGEHSYDEQFVNCNGTVTNLCSHCHETETEPIAYRWEIGTNQVLESVAGYIGNDIEKVNGSIEDGVLTNYCAELTEAITLAHDEAWSIEFEASGNWTGFLLSKTKTSKVAGNQFVWKMDGAKMHPLNRYDDSSKVHNNAIALPDFDAEESYVYRLENRVTVDADGNYVSNMVYFVFNGTDLGAVNVTSGGTTDNYISGTDLVFNYIGASSSYYVNNMKLEYLEIYTCHADETKNHTFPEWTINADGDYVRSCSNCDEPQKAVAQIEAGILYADLAEALEFASAVGEDVKLIADAQVESIYLHTAIDLDLNGHTLTVSGAVMALSGSNVIDTVGGGKLVVDKTALLIQTENKQIPVWNGTDGYILMNCTQTKTKEVVDYENNSAAFYFQPALSADAHEALKAGHSTNGVKVCVTVHWSVDGVDGQKTFYVGDELLKQYLNTYEDGGFTKAFKLTLTGVDKVDDESLTFDTSIVFCDFSEDE